MFIFIFLQEFRINPRESFVVETTDRTVLDFDKFEKVQDGSTLYLLQHEHQALPVAAEEHITFTPHYDTLIRGGMYEYYASQGQAPLAYTLAELIDNALSATAKNKGQRTIEIRVLNDRTVGKPAIVVLDNGCGMTSKQLNNWAVYRLSKFTKESSTFARLVTLFKTLTCQKQSGNSSNRHQVTLREKPPKYPRAIHLREVEHDMQTLYINAAADTFEFRASTAADNGTVEGVIRYHPFLYDKETYPKRPEAPDNDDDDNESGFIDQARKKMPIFECFWNGRLIPYTTVSEFDWCSPNKGAKVPAECYSRLSGVLFTDDRFQVTTNKLTFTDLELKLKNKDTIYTTVVNGQKSSKRANIQNEFSLWLQNCHEKFDKQVKFLGYKETITRTDVPTKRMQHPWGTFSSIEWDGKTYTIGQRVKSLRTIPVFYGTIVRFLLYGIYDGDVFATGGQVEPRALYDTVRIIPISKIDKTATDEAIKKNIDNDCVKIPELLKVVWPKGNEWPQNAVCPAGTPLGPINVEILNKKGESMSSMPSAGQGKGPALSMHLKIVLHGSKGDQVISDLLAQHSAKWGFEFKKNENLTQLGKYTLSLNTVMKDNDAPVVGGIQLPNFTLKFTIKEGDAQSFITGRVSPSVRVGVPFNIPLQFKDLYGHLTAPPPKLLPHHICLWVNKYLVENDTCFPGIPHSLHVMPEEDPVKVENGNPVAFSVEILDEAGNITAHPRQIVRCQVEELPLVTVDCSNTGAGQLMTKPINLKIIDGQPQVRKAHFEMPSQRHVASVIRELKVIPSTRVALMQVYSADDDNLVLRNNDKIDWVVGGVLENLFYRLYDEAGSEVTVSAEIASMIKVSLTYTVVYLLKSPSFSCSPRPDEPTRLKVTLPQNTVRLGEALPGNINLDSVAVTGVRFNSGPLGHREMCFKYATFTKGFCVCAVFSVTVVSEEGSPITTFNPAAVSMFLWNGVSSGETPPPTYTYFLRCRTMSFKENVVFFCRDKQIPEHAGPHVVQFSLRVDETKQLFSDQIQQISLKHYIHFVVQPCDADNQAKISQLTKQKDELTLAIALMFKSQTIDTLINKKSADVDKILKMPRRSCSIRENFMLQPDVLGTVGHLAFVEDDTAARVISWHISGDMDCIITKTKEAAERIYRETQGRQQVMALDSVFVSPGNRPLPHIRNGHTLFDPPGNPVYARELLICPNEQESCGIGELVVVSCQNKSPCPTILTRQGDRVSAKGKFGGAQNKAPATQMFPMFGAPLPQTYHTLRNDIELLQQYQIAVRKREEAEKERNDHLKNLYSPEMKMKKQELEEKKKLLEDIDRQLGGFVDHGVSFLLFFLFLEYS
uniref:Structural maintenance of chromosomes flexible hinge domain containing 1 n=1 Tax=Acanthochromis polyacanthus TaxID=80966 RepID=A0A3Q1FDU6_9TELE